MGSSDGGNALAVGWLGAVVAVVWVAKGKVETLMVMWMAAGGSEGEHSRNERGKCGGDEERGSGGGLKRKTQNGRCVGSSGVWAPGSECQGVRSVLRPDFRLNTRSYVTVVMVSVHESVILRH